MLSSILSGIIVNDDGLFVSLQNSPYFKSEIFEKILATVSSGATPFVLKQSDNKLKLVAHGIDGLQGAWAILNKLG